MKHFHPLHTIIADIQVNIQCTKLWFEVLWLYITKLFPKKHPSNACITNPCILYTKHCCINEGIKVQKGNESLRRKWSVPNTSNSCDTMNDLGNTNPAITHWCFMIIVPNSVVPEEYRVTIPINPFSETTFGPLLTKWQDFSPPDFMQTRILETKYDELSDEIIRSLWQTLFDSITAEAPVRDWNI